jgi:hypothetical protein
VYLMVSMPVTGSRTTGAGVLDRRGHLGLEACRDAHAAHTYLAVACIAAPTRLLRWAGTQFTEAQVLDGLGARELAVTRCGGRTLLIRVNFIPGTPVDPRPALDSQVLEWDGTRLHEVAAFPACGGTDVAVLVARWGRALVAARPDRLIWGSDWPHLPDGSGTPARS